MCLTGRIRYIVINKDDLYFGAAMLIICTSFCGKVFVPTIYCITFRVVFMSIDLFLSYYTVCCISLSNVPQAGFTFLNSRAVHDFCCATHDNLYPSVAKLFIMPYYVHSSYEILFNHSCIFKILFSKKLDLQYI